MNKASKTAKSIRLEKLITYVMLSVLVLAWGLDYVGAKIALGSLNTFILLFFRYGLALIVVFTIKMIIDRKFYLSKKDIPIFILCALTGDVGYFYLEYTAIRYVWEKDYTYYGFRSFCFIDWSRDYYRSGF